MQRRQENSFLDCQRHLFSLGLPRREGSSRSFFIFLDPSFSLSPFPAMSSLAFGWLTPWILCVCVCVFDDTCVPACVKIPPYGPGAACCHILPPWGQTLAAGRGWWRKSRELFQIFFEKCRKDARGQSRTSLPSASPRSDQRKRCWDQNTPPFLPLLVCLCVHLSLNTWVLFAF